MTNDAGETIQQIEDTLEQRGTRYGSFANQALLSQTLQQTIMRHYFSVHENPKPLPPYMAEAINQICHKLARIANGDPYYVDSWNDVSGYATLVTKILSGENP